MAGKTYREVTFEWALSLFSPSSVSPSTTASPAAASGKKVASVTKATAKTKTVTPPAPPPQADAVCARFSLTSAELRIVELLYACESSLDVARAARAFGNAGGSAGGVTLEVLRAVLGVESEQLLGPAAILRAHGLVTVGGVPGGLPESTSPLTLAPGLRARWDGRDVMPAELAAGIESVPASDEKTTFPERLEQLLKDARAEPAAQLIKISGVGSGTGRALAAALAETPSGPAGSAILVDGAALQELGPQARYALAQALRREADIASSAVVVTGAAALGIALYALVTPPPSGARTLLVLVDERSVPATPPPAGYLVRALDLTPPPALASAAPLVAASAATAPPTPVVDAIDRARRQATIDAARAMGRPVPQGIDPRFSQPAPEEVAPPPPASAASSRAAAESIVGPMRPARERGKASPPPARAVAAAAAPTVPDPVTSTAAAIPATTPFLPSSASPSAPALVADSAVAGADGALAAGPAAETATAIGEPDASGSPDESLPYLDVPTGATSGDLIQIITRATNPFQRADLIGRLRGEQRDGQLVSIVRAHLKVDHPAVRAAAEEAMTRIFGPNWSRARSIPKPVQPPHSGER